MTKEYVFKDIEKLTTFNFKPNCSITFHRGNDKVGALDFNGPEMTFSGDMDESAKLFLEFVATSFKARLEQERAVGYREGHMAALSQRTWVGLTDEERNNIWDTIGNSDAHGDVDGWSGRDVMKAIEAALKAKNT